MNRTIALCCVHVLFFLPLVSQVGFADTIRYARKLIVTPEGRFQAKQWYAVSLGKYLFRMGNPYVFEVSVDVKGNVLRYRGYEQEGYARYDSDMRLIEIEQHFHLPKAQAWIHRYEYFDEMKLKSIRHFKVMREGRDFTLSEFKRTLFSYDKLRQLSMVRQIDASGKEVLRRELLYFQYVKTGERLLEKERIFLHQELHAVGECRYLFENGKKSFVSRLASYHIPNSERRFIEKLRFLDGRLLSVSINSNTIYFVAPNSKTARIAEKSRKYWIANQTDVARQFSFSDLDNFGRNSLVESHSLRSLKLLRTIIVEHVVFDEQQRIVEVSGVLSGIQGYTKYSISLQKKSQGRFFLFAKFQNMRLQKNEEIVGNMVAIKSDSLGYPISVEWTVNGDRIAFETLPQAVSRHPFFSVWNMLHVQYALYGRIMLQVFMRVRSKSKSKVKKKIMLVPLRNEKELVIEIYCVGEKEGENTHEIHRSWAMWGGNGYYFFPMMFYDSEIQCQYNKIQILKSRHKYHSFVFEGVKHGVRPLPDTVLRLQDSKFFQN